MLKPHLVKRLEALRQLPMLPTTAAEALTLIEDPRTSATNVGRVIERDQALTARVLKVANSPFYGFSREISTIDLAVVILGFDGIREIILSLVVQGVFSGIRDSVLDVQAFWKYSVFCGSTSRYLARILGYRLAGEAFVAGLMHDIGVLIIAQFFPKDFEIIRAEQHLRGISLVDAETKVLTGNHCEIGGWLAEQWNLPKQLIHAIAEHHTPLVLNENQNTVLSQELHSDFYSIEHPLTAISALSEWFAGYLGFKYWAKETVKFSPLNIYPVLIDKIVNSHTGEIESTIEVLKPILMAEFEKASVLLR